MCSWGDFPFTLFPMPKISSVDKTSSGLRLEDDFAILVSLSLCPRWETSHGDYRVARSWQVAMLYLLICHFLNDLDSCFVAVWICTCQLKIHVGAWWKLPFKKQAEKIWNTWWKARAPRTKLEAKHLQLYAINISFWKTFGFSCEHIFIHTKKWMESFNQNSRTPPSQVH